MIVDKFDVAAQLYTTQRLENNQLISKAGMNTSNTSTIYGVARTNSKDGIVDVYISDDTTYSSYSINAEGTVSIPTNVYVASGDKVMITLVGTGVTKHPVVTGVVGRGDITNNKILELEADTGKFRTLIITDQNGSTEIDGSKIKTGSIEARSISSDVADFNQIKSDSAILNSLIVDDGSGTTVINGDKIKTGTIDGNKIKAGSISTDKLNADVVTADELKSNNAIIQNLINEKASIQDLNVTNGNVTKLSADQASFKSATAEKLDAVDANIKKLNTDKLNVTDAAAKYANIDFANIGEAAIKAFYAKSGVISDVVISDGHVTGKLVGVTIKGDLIEGGTVVADKLVMLGEDGLYYKLNTNGKTVSSEQTEYNSLNGSIITAKSITAEKVNVNDLVAFGATIGGLHISNGSLYSGAKNAISNTTNGVYMDSEGQFALGNASNFLKFYKDTSGKWKLVISADAMTLGTGGSVEDAINESAKTVTLQYYRSTSATSLVGGSWADKSADWVDGTYIWTRSKSVDRAGNATYSEPACITGNTGPQGKQGIQGVKGVDGADGVGISSVTITYGVSASPSTKPSNWQPTVPNVPQGQYLWTQTVTDYTSSSVPDTVTYTYALQGKDGAKGATGSQGKDGTSVTVSSIQYQVGTSPTTAPTGTWSNSVLATSTGQYLWTKTTFSDGKVAYGVAAHGSTGPQGPKGTDGKSPTVALSKSGTVTTITVHNADGSTSTQKVNDGTNGTPGPKGTDGKTTYLHVKYSNDNGATFTANSGETVGTYIGTCTDFNSADPTTVSSYKWARIKGDTGATGVGVKGTTVTYQSSSSGTTIPTGTWSSGIPSVPEGSFLWTRIVYSYSNGTSTTAYSVGKMGAKGDKGATGNTGTAGRGIKSSSVTYQVGNSQTAVPTGSWVTSVPKLSSAAPYLWTRTILTYTDNTTSTAYSVGTTLDGVNVGGRNLLLDSGTLIKHSDDGNSLRITPALANETYNSNNVTKQTKTDNHYNVVLEWTVKDCKPGGCYTFSFYVKGSCEKVDTYFYGPNGYIAAKAAKGSDNSTIYNAIDYSDGHIAFPVSNDWKLVWVTFELAQLSETNPTTDKYILIRMDNSVNGKDVYVSSPKLELGNTATDWSPAPEDVATDISDAANTAANALEKANNNEKNITEATKAILNIQENIKALVTGPNGSSLMTQTNKGWTFDMSSIERTLNEATDDITNLNSNLSATNNILNSTKKLLDDVTKKTAYINFATDDSGNPCIELGKQDNPFKLRITNTSIDFMQGSQKIAYLTNHQLYIESSVITDSILIGQNGTFIWKKRANNHLGLRYT